MKCRYYIIYIRYTYDLFFNVLHSRVMSKRVNPIPPAYKQSVNPKDNPNDKPKDKPNEKPKAKPIPKPKHVI